jgi:hypothetical protein
MVIGFVCAQDRMGSNVRSRLKSLFFIKGYFLVSSGLRFERW